MKPFQPIDFLDFDSLLTPQELEIRAKAARFADEHLIPIAGDCFEKGVFPLHLTRLLGEQGYFGATLKGYGCAGMGEVAYGLIMQEIERGDSGFRSLASIQSALVMYPIYTFGTEAQKQRWLPGLAKGELLGCFGLTEPDHGSDPGGMETYAVKDGNFYVLNGAKRWIGNATICDVAMIWAKNEQGVVEGFVVEKGTPGYSASEIPGKWSLRTIISGEIRLQDCRVPAANRLPLAQGLKSPLMCLTKARYGIAWGVIGAAMGSFHETVEYTKNRQQFGKPIASFQLVQEKLAEMLTEITKMQFMTLQLGRLMEQGKAKHYHVSMAKRNNVHYALEIARWARDLLGGNGITLDYACGRHLCNLESVKTYEGTHNIHTLVLGEHITGISAYR